MERLECLRDQISESEFRRVMECANSIPNEMAVARFAIAVEDTVKRDESRLAKMLDQVEILIKRGAEIITEVNIDRVHAYIRAA